ncbi:MAG: MTH1187 family thiamine-binding protein [Firmicutes bacterium]|nr:MTH1187 family thiamine-binding protein [Bacillota bacterium]
MAVVEVKVVPVGTGSASMSSYVASCYRVVEEEGLKHQLTPTSTIIEGDLAHVLNVARRMHQEAFAEGVERVVTNIYIDERRDKPTELADMVEAVMDEV